MSMAAGILLMFASCYGCVATQKNHKGLLFCYLVILTGILALQCASAALAFEYGDQFNAQVGHISSDISSPAANSINNNVLSMYQACCTGCPPDAKCNNAQSFYNFSLPNCNNTAGTILCQYPQVCSANNNITTGCYTDLSIPTLSVDPLLCSTMTYFVENGAPLVGPVTKDSCGNGTASTFQNNVYDYMGRQTVNIAIGLVVVAAIEFSGWLAACYLVFCGHRHQ